MRADVISTTNISSQFFLKWKESRALILAADAMTFYRSLVLYVTKCFVWTTGQDLPTIHALSRI